MIARVWRGTTRPDAGDRYQRHLEERVVPELRGLAGFRGIDVLRRNRDRLVEFVVITRWESMDAVAAFTGPDTSVAVVAPAAQALLAEFDRHATHYEIVTAISKNHGGLGQRR